MVYDIEVVNNSITWPDDSNKWGTTYSLAYQWNTTIYMYQLSCPKCKTLNWGQLNTEIICKGKLPDRIRGRKVVEEYCGATLKAVTKKADYEVEVG